MLRRDKVGLEIDLHLLFDRLEAQRQRALNRGELGRYRTIVVGAPDFAVDQRVVVFLGAHGPTVPHIVGFNQGVFRVVRAADDSWVVSPPPAVAGAAAGRVVRGDPARRPVPLADFEQQVRTLAGAAR